MARSPRLVVTLLAGVGLVAGSLGLGAGDARPARDDTVTLSVLSFATQRPGLDVLIANFERVYPNINVEVTYASSTAVRDQLEATQLAAGSAPDVLSVSPGCFKSAAVCPFAKAGHLAAMVNKPWVKWSVPLVTSLDKYGQGLYAFSPQLAPFGVFTNDDLFKKLGLKVPQTYSQLLDLCQKAKAAGTVAMITSADAQEVSNLLVNLAVGTLYGKDKQWAGRLRAASASFDGTPGWHQALQEYIDMNDAGCFQPGFTGITGASSHTQFAQGQGLMDVTVSSNKGQIDAANPGFSVSFHPFPGGAGPNQTANFINIQAGFGVNAHSNEQHQAAAQTFIDFMARPKQNSLFTRINGGLSQYEFLHRQLPAFMAPYASVLAQHQYIANPLQQWWNPGVLFAMQQNQIGLITGQRSIDDVLNAMDAAWKQGPA